MGTPILSVRDDQGNIIPIPAIQGRDGVDGKDGKDGAAGPNLINQNTLTPMAGILMGSGGSVKTAVSGTDYATPAEVATKVGKDDYTRTINTATTTGTASNYILTLDPAPDALAQGVMLLVNFHVGSDSATVPPMLNVKGLGGNDFGAKYLFPVGQNSGKPFAAGVHIIFYDGTYWRMLDNAFLPIVGGTVYGSIVPRGALEYNLGSSEKPWQYMYASYGRFGNTLAVDGNSVWHAGNLPVEDFVTGCGTSGIWSYRIWSSGTKECWGKDSHNFTITSSAYGVYTQTGGAYQLELPFALTDSDKAAVSILCSAGLVATDCWATGNKVNINVMSHKSQTISVDLRIHIIGK